jgi:phosphatidylinositol alpha-1,6-mannosyltransferase
MAMESGRVEDLRFVTPQGPGTAVTVLLVSEVFPPAPGGSGRWLYELYRRLPGVEVSVVAGTSGQTDIFDSQAGLPITRIDLRFANWGLAHLRAMMQYARAFALLNRAASAVKPDEIHCGKCLPEGLLAAAIRGTRGIPYRCFVHGEELTLAEASRELRVLTRTVLRHASQIVVNSLHTKALVLDRWSVDPKRIIVMHPGVDTSRFRPAPCDATKRARLGWTGRKVVLTVGALQKRKGQDMVLRALPAIRARCPEVLYSMVGEGWERDYLESLVDELSVRDVVEFRNTPTDEELVGCYQQCDLFALPNRRIGWDFEGFGIVLLEAQACGKPVVTGTDGGTAETIVPSVTGELVACDAPAPLAEAIVRLLDDPARRAAMGTAGRAHVVAKFDWSVLRAQAARAFLNGS